MESSAGREVAVNSSMVSPSLHVTEESPQPGVNFANLLEVNQQFIALVIHAAVVRFHACSTETPGFESHLPIRGKQPVTSHDLSRGIPVL